MLQPQIQLHKGVYLKQIVSREKYCLILDEQCKCVRLSMVYTKLTLKELYQLHRDIQTALFEYCQTTGERI